MNIYKKDSKKRGWKMSNYRFSDLSVEQLRQEAQKYKEKAQRAEQLGNISEVSINERKMQVALAYMLNPKDFHAEIGRATCREIVFIRSAANGVGRRKER